MKNLFKLILGNSFARIGLAIVTLFIFVAVAAPLLTKHAPDKRTGNPHEYPSFVVKQAQNNPDGWVAKNLADDRRTLIMSKKAASLPPLPSSSPPLFFPSSLPLF